MSNIDTKKLPLSLIDDLTQLCNRRFIYNNMPKIITRTKTPARTSLFMIDVDDFKKVNDTFGHLAGDELLVELAKRMKKSVAENGIVARYAGDEFVILLPGQDEKQASTLGEVILREMTNFKWSIKDKKLAGLNLSMGVAVYPEDSTSISDLINRADQALYAAKNAGKNRILSYKSVSKEIKKRIKLKEVLLRPPLVNRTEEIETLKKHYKISDEGKKQALLAEGDSGIGKTRLLEEFAKWTEKQNSFFLFCKLVQKEEGGPLSGLAELLRIVTNSLDGDKLRDVLTKLPGPELAEILYLYPKLKKFVKNVSFERKPERRAANLFSGLCKILIGITHEKTLVLAVDDLHYANELTLQFFSIVFKLPKLAKLFFIGTYDKKSPNNLTGKRAQRGGTPEDFLGKDLFTSITLKPLIKDEVARLIVSIFSGIKLESKLIENLYETTKGNPLLLCEILKTLVEKGNIRYENNQWKSKAIEAKDIPDSLRNAVGPRIDKLDDETKEMLSYAAVMGRNIDLDILKKFSGYNEGYLMELLDRAVKAGLINIPDLRYNSVSFQTDPAREALSNMVSAQNAALLHQKLAGLIKQHYKDELSTRLGRLIRHLDLAKEKDSASEYRNLSQKLNEDFSLSTDLAPFLKKMEEEKEMEVSAEELLERPLTKKSVKIAEKAILTFRAAAIGSMLYPANHKERVRLQDRAYEAILEILHNDPVLTFTNLEGKLLVNGSDLKQMNIKEPIGATLIKLMEDYSINSMTFKHGLRREEFAYFLYHLASSEQKVKEGGGFVKLLKEGDISHIKVDEVRYEKASEIAKKVAGIKEIEKEKIGKEPLLAELAKGNLLNLSVEEYFDPKLLSKFGLIVEGLLINKNDKKVERIVNKFSADLNVEDMKDKSPLTEGAIQISETLLMYEKYHLLKTLTDALTNRFHRAQEPKEFTQLCVGLQGIANALIEKGNFAQAKTIVKDFKEQISPASDLTEEQRMVAGEQFGKIAHPKVTEALVNAFRKKLKSNDYANIVEILADLGEYALDSVLELLREEEKTEKDPFELYVIRHSVAMVLKKIGQPAIDSLKEMLADDRAYVVKNVIEVFGYIGNKDIVPLLVPALRDGPVEVRIQCVLTLKKIATGESLKLLCEALKDKDKEVRQKASLAITRTADQSFKKELEPLLKDESVKDIVKEIIQKIQAKKKK